MIHVETGKKRRLNTNKTPIRSPKNIPSPKMCPSHPQPINHSGVWNPNGSCDRSSYKPMSQEFTHPHSFPSFGSRSNFGKMDNYLGLTNVSLNQSCENTSTDESRYSNINERQDWILQEMYKNRHLCKNDLDNLPTAIYHGDTEESIDSNNSCPICLEGFSIGQELRSLQCGHLFHPRCVDRWFLGNISYQSTYTNSCPICKEIPKEVSNPIKCSIEIPSSSFARVGASLISSQKSPQFEKSTINLLASSMNVDPAVVKARDEGIQLMMMVLDAAAAQDEEEYFNMNGNVDESYFT